MRSDKIFIIAEVSANHGKNFERAVRMIRKAKKCGADAVKFQAYTPDSMTINCRRPAFMIKHPQWGGQSLYDLYKKAYTPWRWFPKLKKIADNEKIAFFATAFDQTSVDMLEDLNVPFHKIASFELVDIPLIKYIGKTKKTLIISTGMSTEKEIADACYTARKSGSKNIILLKCVSAYPAQPESMNLNTIADMKKKFKCPVGLSDHTTGTQISLLSVGLGVCMIEKHFKLSNRSKTPDSFFSITPEELKKLVQDVRMAEKALGQIKYGGTTSEQKSKIFRRSLFAVKDIAKGEAITINNVRSIRPGIGLPPKNLKKILGMRTHRAIKRGTPLTKNMLE